MASATTENEVESNAHGTAKSFLRREIQFCSNNTTQLIKQKKVKKRKKKDRRKKSKERGGERERRGKRGEEGEKKKGGEWNHMHTKIHMSRG
jgi:hypothetical protein